MSDKKYDLIVIGGGSGGSPATHTANENGYSVAQIERAHIGGTCLNYGCDPTKTLLHIGQLRRHALLGRRYGLEIADSELDWQAALARVEEIQNDMRGGTEEEAIKTMREDGIDVIIGEARFVSAHEVEVNGKRLYGKNILVATGTEPLVPDIDGLEETGYITNQGAVTLSALPKRLAVVGSGPVGTEFAQLFHNFGVEVCLFERSEHILPLDDVELANALAELLEEEGISIFTNAELLRTEPTDDGKCLTFDCGSGEEKMVFDAILLALGRKPALKALDLDAAGVKVDNDKIVVDEMLRTSVPHIWAAGDIATDFPFTHTASSQSALLADNIFADEPTVFDDTAIPWVTYTMPELAHVGKTEAQLEEEGVDYRIGSVEFADVARAQTTGQTDGKVKLLVGEDGKILGGHILAANAGDLIAPIVLAMRSDLTISALQETILPYPTMVSAIRQAAQSVS